MVAAPRWMVALPLIAEMEPATVCAHAEGAAGSAIKAKSRIARGMRARDTVFLFTNGLSVKLRQSLRGKIGLISPTPSIAHYVGFARTLPYCIMRCKCDLTFLSFRPLALGLVRARADSRME